jgi:DNA repair photolyase
MAAKGLAKVYVSVTTLDKDIARRMEPRAPIPGRRLEAIERLAQAGVPAGVMVAPIVPAVNDSEIEAIMTRAYAAGAREAGYVMLRLPLELRDIFREWLLVHYPDRLRHSLSLVQSTRGGKDYDSQWGKRMAGSGPYAWMIGRRFEIAAKRLGFNEAPTLLRSDLFEAPEGEAAKRPKQLTLF